jgi:hypothetical protein
VSKPSVNKSKIARSLYERLTVLTNLIATRSGARSVVRPLRDCCAPVAIILVRNRSLGLSLPALSSGVRGSALNSSVGPGVVAMGFSEMTSLRVSKIRQPKNLREHKASLKPSTGDAESGPETQTRRNCDPV